MSSSTATGKFEIVRLSDCQVVRLSDTAGKSADAYPPISHVARVTSQDSCVIRLISLSTHFCNDSHACIESSLDRPVPLIDG